MVSLRLLKRPVVSVCIAVMVLAVGIVCERAFLVNGQSYPSWLATGEVLSTTDADLAKLHDTVCNGQGVEVYLKAETAVLRCGIWFLPGTKTFLAPRPAKWGADPTRDLSVTLAADQTAAIGAAAEYLTKIGADVTERELNVEDDEATVPSVLYQGQPCTLTLRRVPKGAPPAPNSQWQAERLQCNGRDLLPLPPASSAL